VAGLWALKWAWQNVVFQSIGIDENNTIHLQIFSSIKTVITTGLVGLWALEWAWLSAETNLRCAGSSGICMPNPNSLALILSEITAFTRTDGETDMARSTRLVAGSLYILYVVGNASLQTNLVYPVTRRT